MQAKVQLLHGAQASTTEFNPRDLVRAFYERIWNGEDMDAAAELLAVDVSYRGGLGAEVCGRASLCDYVRTVRSALEDYRCEILDCVSERTKVFAKLRFSGVHVGSLRDRGPKARTVVWLGAALFRIEHRVITEVWVLGDCTAAASSVS